MKNKKETNKKTSQMMTYSVDQMMEPTDNPIIKVDSSKALKKRKKIRKIKKRKRSNQIIIIMIIILN